jgi:hypothetical protein
MADRPTPTTVVPKLSGPKKQHVVPRFYLDGYCRDGLLSVYDRQKNEFRIQTPHNTGAITHYYTFTDADGRRRYDLEHLMCEYEGKAAQIIRKLSAKEQLTNEKRSDMAIFVAIMGFRTPDHIDSLKSANGEMIKRMSQMIFGSEKLAKVAVKQNPKNVGLSEGEIEQQAKQLCEFVQRNQFTVETDHQWALGMSMSMFAKVADILVRRDWVVMHRDSEKRSFITGDAPLILTLMQPRQNNLYGIGYASSDAMVVFPLTQASILVMYGFDGSFTHGVMTEANMKDTNRLIAERCQRFVMGRDEKLVRSLVEHVQLDKTSWQPKVRVS